MREWPESFLSEDVLETGVLPEREPLIRLETGDRAAKSELLLAFEGVSIKVSSSISGLRFRLSEMFHTVEQGSGSSIIAELNVDEEDGLISISREWAQAQ